MYLVDFFGCYIVYFCSVLYNLWYWMIFFIYYDKYLFFLRCDINILFVLCLCNKILQLNYEGVIYMYILFIFFVFELVV